MTPSEEVRFAHVEPVADASRQTKAKIGYKRRPRFYGSRPAVAIYNTLDRQFDVAAPDAWVTDITDNARCPNRGGI